MSFFSLIWFFSLWTARCNNATVCPSKTTVSGYSIARDLHNFACNALAWKNRIRVCIRGMLFSGTLIIVHHFLWQTTPGRMHYGDTRAREFAQRAKYRHTQRRDSAHLLVPRRLCNRDYKTAGLPILAHTITIATIRIQENKYKIVNLSFGFRHTWHHAIIIFNNEKTDQVQKTWILVRWYIAGNIAKRFSIHLGFSFEFYCI